jgi:alkylation response protein AidB-like acyl-CoA dehydrogenase
LSYGAKSAGPLELPELVRAHIEGGRDEADRLGKLPSKLLEELRAVGMFRLFTPRELGGFEASVATGLRLLEELGRIDGPVAWTTWNANLGLVAAMLPASGAAKIWANGPDPVIVNSSRPTATARPVDGGFLLDGRWDIISGIDSADWVCLFALVFDGDAPAMTEDGHPDLRLFCVPKSDYTIEETWDVAAMRASGSNSIVLANVFVPADLTGTLTAPNTIDRPLYRVPPFSVVAPGCAAVVLGMAAAALEEFLGLVRAKVAFDGSAVADRFQVQASVGRIDAELRAARLLLFSAAEELDRTAEAEQSATPAQRGLLRAAMSLANKVSREALTEIQELASSSALYQHQRLEHIIRDGLAATLHGNIAPSHFALAGRIHFGLDPQDLVF